MEPKKTVPVMVICGSILAVAGFIGTVIYIFQPWRTCDYDDSPAACSMLPFDAAVLAVAVIATVVGIVLAVGGAIIRYRTHGVSNWKPV